MKVAKAGAAEAFANLGSNYRIGFDTIYNRQPNVITTPGHAPLVNSSPVYPIPVHNNRGAFTGVNRTNWFDRLYRARANGATPLHGALQRTGRYYESYGKNTVNDPWGEGNTSEPPATCRASYAILTTDGYWNSGHGFSTALGIGDVDGDGRFTTLADVAMHYFHRDLRDDIDDNVSATADGKTHQRMTTIGVSLGAAGELSSQTSEPPSANGWPNPWGNAVSPPSGTTWNFNSTTGPRRIDDLWHATVNTEGGRSMVVANNAEQFSEALARALQDIAGRDASGSNLASNGPETTAGSVKFSALYHSTQWWGDLRAFGRDVVTNTFSTTPNWRMSDVANAGNHFANTRPVLTWRLQGGGGGRPLVDEYSSDTRFQRANVTIAQNLQYLRGVRTGEGNGYLRERTRSAVGDIVHSTPVYVSDNQHVFVGANDGMLHAVDARTGRVSFSYVPRGINMEWFASLSEPGYQHRFFVDGQITVGRRHNSGSQALVAALGRGGKGVFGLDVGSPESFANNKVMWDLTFQPGSTETYADADMGYVLGKIAVTRTAQSGNTEYALVPNGINSASGQAALFVYDASSGGTPKKLTVGTPGNNGLMVIETADLNNDGRVDLVYGGDLQGNVWRWDFRDSNNPTGTRIFTAVDASGQPQAITGGLTVSREPVTRRIFVAFGTGRLLTENDLPWISAQGKQMQSFYGVIDNLLNDGSQAIAHATGGANRYSELTQRTIPYTGEDSKGRPARAFERFSPLQTDTRGWYVDLGVPSPFADNERVISAPVVAGRALWISSIWPTQGDGCDAPLGNGYLTALDVFTGTNTSTNPNASNTNGYGTTTFIDVNVDGEGNDRLADTSGLDDVDGFITSVSFGEVIGSPDLSDIEVHVQGGSGNLHQLTRSGVGGDRPGRIMWRELFR